MRAPQDSSPEIPQTTEASVFLSPAALKGVYAAITAAIAVGLGFDLALPPASPKELAWPVLLGIATVAWGLWIVTHVQDAGRRHRVGFVLMLCLQQISWTASLGNGHLPSSLILLPIVAGTWASVTRHRGSLPVHLGVIVTTLVVIGAVSGVLPGGAAFGGRASIEWAFVLVSLALCVFCGSTVNRTLRQYVAQVQSGAVPLDRLQGEHDAGQQMMRAIIDTSPYAIAAIDIRGGQAVLINDAFENITGYPRERLLGQHLAELGIVQSEGGTGELVRRVRETGHLFNVDIPIRTRQGEQRLMRGGASLFELNGKEFYVLVAREVTDEQLTQMERDAIFAASPIGIFTERDGRIRVISAELERWMGWSEGSGAGRPVSDLVGGDAALRELRARSRENLHNGDFASFEWPMFRAEGMPFTARFVGRTIDRGAAAGHQNAVWIVQDVSQEIEQQRLLEIARIRAEEVARVKSRFLVNTSHQLRTPMNALLNLAELARGSDHDPTQQRHLVGHVAASAQSLASLLSDILDLSSLEEGSLLLLIEDYHLGHLIDRIDATFRPLIQQRGLFLKVHMGSGCDTWISGDARRVRQIITNYLNSALNHSVGGSIELTVSRNAANQLRIEVRCEGAGISEGDAARVFSAFESPGKTTERQAGTALGLAICRDLAHLMHGEVGVIRQPGAGMTLWVELPLTLAVRTPAAQTHAGSLLQQSLSGLRVLLVEDDQLSTVSLTLMLQRWGMHVESVSDGMQAVRRAMSARDSGRPFDVVLMDLHLPFMHGAEATRWLRREGMDAARLPVIVLTAGTLQSEHDEALSAGANEVLGKPVGAEDLRRRIIELLPRSTTTAA